MVLTNKTVLTIGITSFTIAILLRYIFYDNFLGGSILDFIEGVIIGLSFTMNLFFLIKFSKKNSFHV